MLLRGLFLKFLLLALMTWILLGGNSPGESYVIQITCQSPTGCFRLIGQAIELAPWGAVIRIGPGVYNEYPIMIDKALTLEGAGIGASSSRTATTRILVQAISASGDPITAITILGKQALSVTVGGIQLEPPRASQGIRVVSQTVDDVQVTISDSYLQSAIGIVAEAAQYEGLLASGPILNVLSSTIQASETAIFMNSGKLVISAILEDLRIQSSDGGFNIEGSSGGVPIQLTVTVRDSALSTGGTAIDVRGKAHLTLQSNEIESHPVFMNATDGSELFVYDNKIISIWNSGYSGFPIVSLQGVEARFERNRISERSVRQKMAGISALGGQYSFIENHIEGYLGGMVLGGKTTADFQRNLFSENVVGLVLQAPPCAQDPAPEIRFEGFITGSENQFTYNSKADLCPTLTEFPWPPGFVKP